MDLRISELPPLLPADLRGPDLLPLADVSASETKKLSAKDLLQFGVLLIDDESIPSEKLMDVRHEDLAPVGAGGMFLAGPALVGGRISGRRITGTDLPPATSLELGAVIVGAGFAIAATGLLDLAPATTTTIGGVKIDPAGGLETDTEGVLRHVTNLIPPGTRSGISYDEWGHITGAVALVGSDLPAAKERELGGVMIPADSGLAVTGTGELRHSHTIAAQTRSGVSIDSRGHVTALAPLVGGDLPIATQTTIGGVMVPGGLGLEIDGAGNILHATPPGLSPGTFTKVTVNSLGHIVSGTVLSQADIPLLDGSHIASGALSPEVIPADGISGLNLADYSTAFIQESQPYNSDFIGQLWLQESSAQLRMWNGNSWMPCGFGAVMLNNLRFGGTFNAATGTVVGVTQLGRESGLAPGQTIPAASAVLAGLYLLCTVPGTGVGVATGTQFTTGDWILSLDEAQGWIRIDVTDGSGGGGGGGASGTLDQLVDVVITAPKQGDILTYNATTGLWVNGTASDPGLY